MYRAIERPIPCVFVLRWEEVDQLPIGIVANCVVDLPMSIVAGGYADGVANHPRVVAYNRTLVTV